MMTKLNYTDKKSLTVLVVGLMHLGAACGDGGGSESADARVVDTVDARVVSIDAPSATIDAPGATDAMAPDAMAPDAMAPDAMAPDAMAPDAMAMDPDAGAGTCTAGTVAASSTPGTTIDDSAPVNDALMIAGADTTTTDVNATVNITHTFSGDLLVVLTSPGGTTVALTTNNGGGSDDVYAGTTWDDNAELLTTNPDNYADGVATPLLIPEGALSPFNNEDPNGTWTLTIVDDAAGDSGTLVSWSLAIATSDMALTPTTSSTSSTTVLPINDDTVTDTVVIAAAGNSICDVKVTTSITHTYSGDLVIFLGSPAGTFVPLTRQRGGSNDDVYNGTVWDDSAADTASDFTYVDLVAATALVPEGALGALVGEDPNGTWTLGIIDLAAGDSGQLTGWTLDVDTCTCP